MVNAAGQSIGVTADATGHVVSVTDLGGHAASFRHDDAGDLVEVTDPAGRRTRYAYDDARLLTAMTDPAGALLATSTTTRRGRPRRILPEG